MDSKIDLVYKIVEPREETDKNPPAIVMLHGRGTDEHDLLGLAPFLDQMKMVFSVRAPFQFQWGPGYAWYDIEEVGKPDKEKFPVSLEKIQSFIEQMQDLYPINSKKIYLLGFSMGAVMAQAAAYTNPDKIAGVVAHSGYIAESDKINYKWEKLNTVDIFIAHGAADPVIPIQFGRRANELLKKHNVPHTYKEYPIGHTISQESLSDFVSWLSEQINRL